MNLKIVNIHNKGRKIYLFSRDDKGKQIITEDTSFFPYYYQKNTGGKFISYDGSKLSKIFCKLPSDVPKMRNDDSYEADIIYTKRYLIDKVNEIVETKIKYLFIDIEVLCDHFPDQYEALYPISCITVYNSLYENIQTWYLEDYGIKNEKGMINDFINYIKVEELDILTGWNFPDFDYVYLYNRITKQFNKNFAEIISPSFDGKSIGVRYGQKDVMYPAGISIVDYRLFYKKIVKGLKSYSLDNVLKHEVGKGKTYNKVDFSKLNPEIKLRNIDDVKKLVDIENKYNFIPHYDRIRRFSKIEWEDFGWNSRIIDQLLLSEAKNKSIILPMKPKSKEKKEFEGAFRIAYETGRFFNVGKYDLSGAYMYTIIDLCLDTANITDDISKNVKCVKITDRKTRETIAGYNVEQNPNALLPSVVKKLVDEKNKLKTLKKNTNPESQEYKSIEEKYEALKSIVLSAWGVMGNKFFRLYDSRIAGMITSVVRDLLHYVKDKLKEQGYNVIYVDTDGVFIDGKGDLTELLNNLVQQWSMDRFNKKLNIEFDYEGNFEKLLIVGLCHYIGHLNTGNGVKIEIKGVEAKRSSSAKFEAKFQEELIDKLLNKEPEDQILNWIKDKVDNFKNQDILDISFPAKLSKKIEDYKVNSIHKRALQNTQKINPKFIKHKADLFYYAYVKGKEEVLAFDENNLIDNVDYNKMLERNIYNKCRAIFEAMKWTNSIKEIIPNYLSKKSKNRKIQHKSSNNLSQFLNQ